MCVILKKNNGWLLGTGGRYKDEEEGEKEEEKM